MRSVKPQFHDAASRAAAAGHVPAPTAEEIAAARLDQGRVRGPHLRSLRPPSEARPAGRTGVRGISYIEVSPRSHCRHRRSYFVARLGKRQRQFCIQTLGRELAWEKALRARAEHERRVTAINARILAARKGAA